MLFLLLWWMSSSSSHHHYKLNSRWTYADFFKRYRVLATSKDIVKPDLRKTCENLLGKLIKVGDGDDAGSYF